MPRTPRAQPHEHSIDWPDIPCNDVGAEAARRLALNLRDAFAARNLTLRGAAQITGVDHSVISKVLRGHTWADLRTIALLEHGLDTVLWPARTPQGAPDLSHLDGS